MVKRDVATWTSMICGYCNIGKTGQALVLFERMRLEGLEPYDFMWNVMIAGYARGGDSIGAFALFSRMTREGLVPDIGIKPNHVTLTGLLPAMWIDRFNSNRKRNSWVDVQDGAWISVKNIASWNAMIGCYGKHGMVELSIQLFERMQEEGMQANEVTFICILSACSHNGLVEEGLKIFRSMKESYGIELKKPGGYVTLSNIYAADGDWEEVENVRKMMKESNNHEKPGYSWLEKMNLLERKEKVMKVRKGKGKVMKVRKEKVMKTRSKRRK
uniref:Pentacotripeptide-repeat region of PRORP domain-containing protein n=1 Tax=Fagus sylvatica TaxID=28930 RepID=A0A2N9J931_FAGSY